MQARGGNVGLQNTVRDHQRAFAHEYRFARARIGPSCSYAGAISGVLASAGRARGRKPGRDQFQPAYGRVWFGVYSVTITNTGTVPLTQILIRDRGSGSA